MVEGILVGIFGNSAYSVIKHLVKTTFANENEEISKKVYNALESASESFFKKYGDKFGKPSNSFLAREENWKLVLRSTYYSAEELKTSDFNPKGYEDSEDATIEALEYFISCVEKEMHKDWFLDKTLTERSYQDTVLKNQKKMVTALDNILNDKSFKQKNENRLAHPDYPDGWLPEDGKPYTHYFQNGSKVNFVRRGNIIHLEQTLPGGGIAYYEVDPEGRIKDVDFPYPLEEYQLSIPDEVILREEKISFPNGFKQTFIKLKWGIGNVTYITNIKGKLVSIDLKCRFKIKHGKKLIKILKPNFNSGN